ncbi:MAG: hypothetical protein KY475_02205 [Planctomycetes bacterium]|nr:hypothetical protein [Planctomycetota bacterium]
MKPSLGWTLLSREALRRAETHLRDDVQGVRDEIGFLALHQAYADRFFPGTSVLHTRLRYVLFVPWLYLRLIERGERKQVSAALEKSEIVLAGRLIKSNEHGIIGKLTYPEATSQPPSTVYWTALGTWRILRPLADGSYPSRRSVHRAIARNSSGLRIHDDDKQLLEEAMPIFSSLPAPPKEWSDFSSPLNFDLASTERAFIRGCLLAVSRPGTENVPSLMSRLVEHDVRLTDRTSMWGSKVRDVADDEDVVALRRARQAAAISAVGRAIYAALVENMRERHDEVATDNVHRAKLLKVIEEYGSDASQLQIEEIQHDAPGINQGILKVLRATQLWLNRQGRQFSDLYDIYEHAEFGRKWRRARLSRSLAGREKRLEWNPDEHPTATPLHFRWGNVRQLLMDVNGAA